MQVEWNERIHRINLEIFLDFSCEWRLQQTLLLDSGKMENVKKSLICFRDSSSSFFPFPITPSTSWSLRDELKLRQMEVKVGEQGVEKSKVIRSCFHRWIYGLPTNLTSRGIVVIMQESTRDGKNENTFSFCRKIIHQHMHKFLSQFVRILTFVEMKEKFLFLRVQMTRFHFWREMYFSSNSLVCKDESKLSLQFKYQSLFRFQKFILYLDFS